MHIAIAIHNKDTYWRQGLVCLYSVLKNSRTAPAVHILHDSGLTDEEQSHFDTLCGHFSAPLTLYDVTEHPYLQKTSDCKRFTPGTLFKLLIPDIIPAGQVLCLDCDICATLDIGTIFDITKQSAALSPSCLYAVLEQNRTAPGHREAIEAQGLAAAPYFNAGVVLFEISRLHHMCPDFSVEAFRLLHAHPDPLRPDQDTLNRIVAERALPVGFLPSRYNFQTDYSRRHILTPEYLHNKLIHYSTVKPWEYSFNAASVYRNMRRAAFQCIGLEPENPHLPVYAPETVPAPVRTETSPE